MKIEKGSKISYQFDNVIKTSTIVDIKQETAYSSKYNKFNYEVFHMSNGDNIEDYNCFY